MAAMKLAQRPTRQTMMIRSNICAARSGSSSLLGRASSHHLLPRALQLKPHRKAIVIMPAYLALDPNQQRLQRCRSAGGGTIRRSLAPINRQRCALAP
jgi:hypothetical protein